MKFTIGGRFYHEPGIEVQEHVLPSDRRRVGIVNAIRRAWWVFWTGYPDLLSVRRRIEYDVTRFGGRVTWDE